MDGRELFKALARGLTSAMRPPVGPFQPRRFRNRAGRCYELAWRYLTEDAAAANWTLVHGLINGAGHAWLERESETFDPVLNQMFATADYERRARAIYKCSKQEAATMALHYGHFGPWHDMVLTHRSPGRARLCSGAAWRLSFWSRVALGRFQGQRKIEDDRARSALLMMQMSSNCMYIIAAQSASPPAAVEQRTLPEVRDAPIAEPIRQPVRSSADNHSDP